MRGAHMFIIPVQGAWGGKSPALEVPQEGTKALLGRGCNGVEEPLAKTRGNTAHGLHLLLLA